MKLNRSLKITHLTPLNIFLSITTILLLMKSSSSRLRNPTNPAETSVTHKTIVEANHYMSETDLSTNYNVTNVVKNKPLIFILKEKIIDVKQLSQSPITITLNSGESSVSCLFKNETSACALKEVVTDIVKMSIECTKLPCELSWRIMQPGLAAENTYAVDQLGEIGVKMQRAILMVTCNSPQITTFSTDLRLYSSVSYDKLQANGNIYYIFLNSNDKAGYFFLTSQALPAKSCAQVSLKMVPLSIKFNQKNNVIEDVLKKNDKVVYVLDENPSTDFRVDCSLHQLNGNSVLETNISIKLTAKDDSRSTLAQSNILLKLDSSNPSHDFNVVFKKLNSKYKDLQIEMASLNETVMINTQFLAQERQQIQPGQQSYFCLNKDDQLLYKLQPNLEETQSVKLIHIISNDSKAVLSRENCMAKDGCEFSVKAEAEVSTKIYLGQYLKANYPSIVYFDFSNSITKKIREGDVLNLKRPMTAKKTLQIVVNSPSVLVRVASRQKCPLITDSCYQKMLNSHNPIIYQSKSDGQLLLRVTGLDNCQFTLTVLQNTQQYITLQDSIPFSYLFDDKQHYLDFKFTLKKKTQTNFNLIGPTGEMILYAVNDKQFPEDVNHGPDSLQISSDGYISYEVSEQRSLEFVLRVQKREEYHDKYMHFVVIASTKYASLRLEAGVTHYEKLESSASRDFVVQFDRKKQQLINFYMQDFLKAISLSLRVSPVSAFDKKQLTQEYTIEEQADSLDFKDLPEKLCKDQIAQQCQLYLRIKNKMSVPVDIAITLLLSDSIIELKEGVWQSYSSNSVAETSHFYFLPKHKNKTLTLLYRSSTIDLKMLYTIWKTDDESINPAEWPFPRTQLQDHTKKAAQYSPSKFIVIDSQAFKFCWPSCVVLLSLILDKDSMRGTYNTFIQGGSFALLASNNYIEIPEKTKIELTLREDQIRYLLVDLKHMLDKNTITFFTYESLGFMRLTGNVYSEVNPRCPAADDDSDFAFGALETQIKLETIKSKMEINEMSQDQNPHICLMARAISASKFAIEYSSDQGTIFLLSLDSTRTMKGSAGQTVYFQVDASQQFSLKISRASGFPYIKTKMCKSTGDYEECLDQFKSGNRGDQLVDKILTAKEEPCLNCIYFIRFDCLETCECSLHLQSKYSETELLENTMFTDQIKDGVINKYTLTALRSQPTIINVQLTIGEATVNISDYNGLITSKASNGSKVIQIIVPAQNEKGLDTLFDKAVKNNWLSYLDSFDLSDTFTTMHLTVQSSKPKQRVTYSLSYSAGKPQTYLQDGLITFYELQSKVMTKFLYRNNALNEIYVHLSMSDSQQLKKLKVVIYSLTDIADQQSKIDITPTRDQIHKKSPNPTLMMKLPARQLYMLQLTNNADTTSYIQLGVNNKQVIYLPYNHDFPMQLQRGQHIYVIISAREEGYVELVLNKCDQSNPSVAYTEDYQMFVKEEFDNEVVVADQLVYRSSIKIKPERDLYVKIKSPEDDTSVLLLRAGFVEKKSKDVGPKAGQNGAIEYNILGGGKTEISFAGLQCPPKAKSCEKEYKYTAVTATRIQEVYLQLICPSVSLGTSSTTTATITPVKSYHTLSGKYSLQVQMKDEISYVGIKATNKQGSSIFYRPIQVVTTWGQIRKATATSYVLMSIIGLVLFCFLLILCRRCRRKEYMVLGNDQKQRQFD